MLTHKLIPMRYLIGIIILFFFVTEGFGQFKYEKETRVKEKDVPEDALNFIQLLDFDTHIRWYREQGYQEVFFEAKTKFERQRYSIKFTEEGRFFDLEIEIIPDEIPANTFLKIEEYLYSEFDSFSIEKIQIQYTGDAELILDYIKEAATREGIELHYEIVISTKQEGSFVMFEFLFSETGDFVKKAEIVLKSIDNIIY